jgi:hypothetical protein
MLAQSAALIVGAKLPAPLQNRNHGVNEIVETAGKRAEIDDLLGFLQPESKAEEADHVVPIQRSPTKPVRGERGACVVLATAQIVDPAETTSRLTARPAPDAISTSLTDTHKRAVSDLGLVLISA